MSNIICCVVFGHRFEYSDQSFRKILELDNEAVLLAGSARTQVFCDLLQLSCCSHKTKQVHYSPEWFSHQQLYDAFPGLLQYLPGPHQTVHGNYKKIMDFLQKEVERHQEEWNPDDPRDYIDVYLAEMEKVKHFHIFRKVPRNAGLKLFKMT